MIAPGTAVRRAISLAALLVLPATAGCGDRSPAPDAPARDGAATPLATASPTPSPDLSEEREQLERELATSETVMDKLRFVREQLSDAEPPLDPETRAEIEQALDWVEQQLPALPASSRGAVADYLRLARDELALLQAPPSPAPSAPPG